ncbi:MAG TPA: response regulator [Xanthobacteraceae bacterium]
MTAHRILVVDDEPDVRRVIERSLARDPELAILTCTCGQEALARAASWAPDLIVLDVMMPVMDGPATLAGLRRNPLTAGIPVVFLTARAQASELEHFKSIGASGAIAKPFQPKALRASVHSYLRDLAPASTRQAAEQAAAQRECAAPGESPAGLMSAEELAAERQEYLERLRADAVTLIELRVALQRDATSSSVLAELRTVAHNLAGSAGLYGFKNVSLSAAALEAAIIEQQSGRGGPGRIETDLRALLDRIEREQAPASARNAQDTSLTPDGGKSEVRHD